MPAVNPGTTGLSSWWSLDETSGNRADSHGAITLTDNNTVGYAAGKVSNAADYEESADEYLGHATGITLADNTAWSIGCWVNAESWVNPKYWCIMGAVSQYLYAQNDSGTTSMRVRMGGGVLTYTTALSLSTWYFVVATCDGSATATIRVYINGSEIGSGQTIANSTMTVLDVGRILQDGNYTMDGLIDEAFVYTAELSADNVTWLYNSGSGRSYADLTAGNPLGLFAAQMRAMYAYGGVSVG